MIRVTAIIITILIMIAMTGCSIGSINLPPEMSVQPVTDGGQRQSEDSGRDNEQDVDASLHTGKTVIITNPYNQSYIQYGIKYGIFEDEFLSAEALADRFGQERVIHMTWENWKPAEAEKYITDILQGVSEDPEISALILYSPITGDRYIVKALQNVRDDIFVVFVAPIHLRRVDGVDSVADLIIESNNQRLGESYIMQAISMGAETIAHYSFPRHRADPTIAIRLNAMKTAAEREGIRFIDIEAPEPFPDIHQKVPMFLLQDLPRQVERLGVNTAFFATECTMQIPIISQTIATKAIFVSTCCPSPYHAFPEAFGIKLQLPTDRNDDSGNPITRRLEPSELLEAMDEAVGAAGMAGRVSSWAVSDSMMWTAIGFMYADEWLSGNVPQERGDIDIEALGRLAKEYLAQLGVDAGVTLETFTSDGEAIGHYILGDIDYHVYGNK
jgi:hypothetical protein